MKQSTIKIKIMITEFSNQSIRRLDEQGGGIVVGYRTTNARRPSCRVDKVLFTISLINLSKEH